MTKEKTYTEQEAKNMLLQLAGRGVEFIPVNNAYENGNKVWPVMRDGAKLLSLGWRSYPLIHPKFDSPKHFWDQYDRPTFDQTYVWTEK